MAKRYIELHKRGAAEQGKDAGQKGIQDAPAAAAATAPQAPADDHAAVFYLPEDIAARVAQELHDAQGGPEPCQPRALVMVQGKNAKQVFQSLGNAGFCTIAPQAGDWRLDVNPKLADDTVPLGKAPSRLLFENAHAVLEAARESRAQCIFLGYVSQALAQDNRFLARAEAQGMRVFMPMDADATRKRWVECEAAPTDAAPQPTSWRSCHSCRLTFDDAEFQEAGHACPSCGTLARLSSEERMGLILDEGSFQEWDGDLPDCNPLDFPGYSEKIEGLRQRTGHHEAVRTGYGTIGGLSTAVGFMETDFLMGSMGSVVGEKVSRLFDRATEEGLPVVLFCASGGARMQEGLASLMQMAKTACAVERHDRAGLLYISVLTDPTFGGVTASFATLGDIILAEPGTLIGFAGQRVIRDTIKQELPEGFQTAEFALEHGLIDAVVRRHRLRDALRTLLLLHAPQAVSQEGTGSGYLDNGRGGRGLGSPSAKGWLPRSIEKLPFMDLIAKRDDDGIPAAPEGAAARMPVSDRDKRELERHAKREQKRSGVTGSAQPGSAWESVQLARNVHRPTAVSYIHHLSDTLFELHGDRAFADDAAIIAGLGVVDGQPVTIIAQEKGENLQERIRRNFGCPQPEGYRKAMRLMRQAEKFGRPVICLVDTQGAYCGTEAEERGQGNAIAESLALMAGLHVPVVSVILGEGGSGGALALAASNRVAMQENAVYSVLSPEGFASILWKDGSRAPEAAEVMGMSAQQVHQMGVIDDIIPEGAGPAHENPEEAAQLVTDYIVGALRELRTLAPAEVVAQRQQRFAGF